MSNSTSETDRVGLQVNTQDPAAEIFLLDGQYQIADRGVGSLTTSQPPGIYKLKVRAGAVTNEQIVLLREKPEVVSIEPLQFASAAPLDCTSKTHPYHIKAAASESQRVHVRAGSGSSVFVFARDWTPDDEPSWSGFNPAQALTLRAENGDVVADFEKQSVMDLSEDPWAACRVEVDPGFYRLSVRLKSGDAYEGGFPAIAGWHTQIFVLQRQERRDRNDPGEKIPDVARASVFLSRGAAFDPVNPANRLVEVARQGLINERRLLSDDLRAVLRQKFDSPMLGIFGAHLLLLDPKPDLGLLAEIVKNLRALLGDEHPDVEALALAGGLPSNFVFRRPPTLLRSWALAVEASADRPELIPPDSFSASIAARLTSQTPWLIWRAPEQDDAYTQAREIEIEETLRNLLDPSARVREKMPKIDPSLQMRNLVRSLGLPRCTVEEFLNRRTSGSKSETPG
jgi:hypothetical protein